MRIKSFQAASMNDAMKMVRNTLGEQAIIISTTRGKNGKGVNVTAAVEADEAPETPYVADTGVVRSWLDSELAKQKQQPPAEKDKKRKSEDETTSTPSELARILRYHNTPDYLAEQLWLTASDHPEHTLEKLLLTTLQNNFDFRPVEIKPGHEAIMLIGPPGVGKTMTVAKMATEAVLARHKVSVITSDTYKAGGVEQLQSFTDILSIPLQRAETTDELKKAAEAVPEDHVLIIDTPGINPYDTGELQRLGKYISCSRRIEPLLVTNAGMDVNEAADIATNFSYLGVSRLAVTKIDATRRLGGVLTAAHAGNFAFSHFSRHAGAAEGLEAVRPARLAAMMLYFPNNAKG